MATTKSKRSQIAIKKALASNQKTREVVNGIEGKLPIEKGIPIPINERRGGIAEKMDLQLMQVGDSIFVPNVTDTGLQSAARNWAIKAYDQKATRTPFKFITRKDKKGTVNGSRIWRKE